MFHRFFLSQVFKVAKLFQPSIVYVGNACSVFAKKKPKDDPHDSTRMKKALPTIVKKELEPGTSWHVPVSACLSALACSVRRSVCRSHRESDTASD